MTETPTPPRRRWFQFGLRTMFMVALLMAIPLAWLGSEFRLVRERQRLLQWAESHGAKVYRHPIYLRNTSSWQSHRRTIVEEWISLPEVAPPQLRLWIGDEAVSAMRFAEGVLDKTTKQELSNAFPEATLMERLPDGDHLPWQTGNRVAPDGEKR